MNPQDQRWQALSQAGEEARRQGRFGEAEEHFRWALALTEKTPPLGAQRRYTEALHMLGVCYHHLGRPDQAEPLMRKALAQQEARSGPHSHLLWRHLIDLGRLVTALGRPEEAEALF